MILASENVNYLWTITRDFAEEAWQRRFTRRIISRVTAGGSPLFLNPSFPLKRMTKHLIFLVGVQGEICLNLSFLMTLERLPQAIDRRGYSRPAVWYNWVLVSRLPDAGTAGPSA